MKIGCVIPHYDHTATVFEVAAGVRRHLADVLVVDDGSSSLPADFEERFAALDVKLIRHPVNRGKGAALLTAAAEFGRRGFDAMIAIDSDGQHDPADLPKFIRAIEAHPDAVIVGCRDFEHAANIPRASRFGRAFSNFWCRLETGVRCGDTQSGYRAYPIRPLLQLKLHCRRYNFEIEALVRLLWGGCELVEVPVPVTYEKPGVRISHFDPWRDNLRLTLLHTALVTRRLLPIPNRKLVRRASSPTALLLRHPAEFLRSLLRENADPAGLALSAAVGTFLAVLPLFGIHMAVILYVCLRLRLNKVMALAIQNLFMPPFSPFLCIELGYFMRHGRFWSEFTLRSCVGEMHHRLYEWFLGSLVLAPAFAILAWIAVYSCAAALQRRSTP